MKRIVTNAVVLSTILIAGCAATSSRGFLGRGEVTGKPFVASDGRTKITALPYTTEMEREILGTALGDAEQMAIEISVENLLAPSGGSLVFRRHDAQVVFADGTRRYPIDPMRVYQKNRVNTSAAAFWFGISGALIAESIDDSRRANLSEASSGELRLTPDTPSATGFLFFDMERITDRKISELIVDYEEVGVDELWRTTIDMQDYALSLPPSEQTPGGANPVTTQERRRRGIDD